MGVTRSFFLVKVGHSAILLVFKFENARRHILTPPPGTSSATVSDRRSKLSETAAACQRTVNAAQPL
jgi:hypothetical protein